MTVLLNILKSSCSEINSFFNARRNKWRGARNPSGSLSDADIGVSAHETDED